MYLIVIDSAQTIHTDSTICVQALIPRKSRMLVIFFVSYLMQPFQTQKCTSILVPSQTPEFLYPSSLVSEKSVNNTSYKNVIIFHWKKQLYRLIFWRKAKLTIQSISWFLSKIFLQNELSNILFFKLWNKLRIKTWIPRTKSSLSCQHWWRAKT